MELGDIGTWIDLACFADGILGTTKLQSSTSMALCLGEKAIAAAWALGSLCLDAVLPSQHRCVVAGELDLFFFKPIVFYAAPV